MISYYVISLVKFTIISLKMVVLKFLNYFSEAFHSFFMEVGKRTPGKVPRNSKLYME